MTIRAEQGGARERLSARMAGPVLTPSDDGYDSAVRVWNGRFESRPDLVACCHGPADAQAAVEVARESGLRLTVKGGGHDYAGNSAAPGGLLVDLKPMASVAVDPVRRVVTVGPGAIWRDVDAACQSEGLATPGATVSEVGVSGFVLGGGFGWLSRRHGSASDNLLAADVVTADGRLVRASAEENPELLWGLQGGGGNFGIVTSFELALHEVGPEVTAGQVMYPLARAPELLAFYRDYFRDAPDDVMCFAFLLRVPPIPAFPESMHGQIVLDFVLFHADTGPHAEAALAPFRNLGEPLLDMVGPMPYIDLQQTFDAGMARGFRWYSRAQYFDRLSDQAIRALLDNLQPFPGAFTVVYFGAEGGAAGRVDGSATAFPHRSAAHSLHIFPGWTGPEQDDEVIAWTRALHRATSTDGSDAVYVNLMAEDEDERIGAAYGENHQRLAALKAKWDPENLFARNHNIPPSS